MLFDSLIICGIIFSNIIEMTPKNNIYTIIVNAILLNFILSTKGFIIHAIMYPKNNGLNIDKNIQHIPVNFNILIMFILVSAISKVINMLIFFFILLLLIFL